MRNLGPVQGLQILDLACGHGRHALRLAELGARVVALDRDPGRLRHLCLTLGRMGKLDSISVLRADAALGLPLADGSFDGVVVVHFVSPGLTKRLARLIRPGGFLVVETFGGHGENWRALPRPEDCRAELGDEFEILDYRERLVGPTRTEAASVKFMARRR